jgi:hypothetical protein
MTKKIIVPIVILGLTTPLLLGCGGDDSSDGANASTSTTTTGSANSETAPVCATFALIQSAGKEITELDPSNATPAQVKKAVDNLQKSVGAFSSAVSKAGAEVGSDVKSAVSTFESQADAAQGQPPAQRVAALGRAFDELRGTVSQSIDQLNC